VGDASVVRSNPSPKATSGIWATGCPRQKPEWQQIVETEKAGAATEKGKEKVTGADLIAKTVLNKAGHHGSRKATLRGSGLKMMMSMELGAMIPLMRNGQKTAMILREGSCPKHKKKVNLMKMHGYGHGIGHRTRLLPKLRRIGSTWVVDMPRE